jgi:hypothetical protein
MYQWYVLYRVIHKSGISDPCGTVAGMVTPKGSMSTEGKAVQDSVLPYRCSICAPLVTRLMNNPVFGVMMAQCAETCRQIFNY